MDIKIFVKSDELQFFKSYLKYRNSNRAVLSEFLPAWMMLSSFISEERSDLCSAALESQRRLHFAFCILHVAFCILHFAFCILPFAFCILHFAFCTSKQAEIWRQIRHMSCCIGVSEETDGSEKLGLGGKFLLLSHWLKKVRRPLIGQYPPIRDLQMSTNQRSSCNQSETFIRLSTNQRAVGTFLLNLISHSRQSLLRLRCSRTYVWSVFRSLLIIIHWDASRTLVVRGCAKCKMKNAKCKMQHAKCNMQHAIYKMHHPLGCLKNLNG